MENIEIDFHTFNPYERVLKNYKVLPLSDIIAIKQLRSRGIKVNILPEDGRPVNYLFKKGQTLWERIVPLIVSVKDDLPHDLIIAVVYDVIKGIASKIINKKEAKEFINKHYIKKNISGDYYDLRGANINVNTVASELSKGLNYQNEYYKSRRIDSPYFDMQTPIYNNHEPVIVGWANVLIDNIGMQIEKSVIEDKRILQDIKNNKLKGFSVAGIATKSTCNVCNQSYVECNHIAGQNYNGIACVNSIERCLIAECSIVEEPVNQGCLIDILSNELN